ncbi:MAG: SAM-dependent methyltransferase [Crocinitomicaceae bacterium]|nr:SAM-dependent methyltransferase [Crocinitomicaceae bacterium]
MSENLRTYSKSWEDYELLDAGGGKKLERWGNIITIRPEMQAYFHSGIPYTEWRTLAHWEFVEEKGQKGKWKNLQKDSPKKWSIGYKRLKFNLELTNFKHVGLFPEQQNNWDFISSRLNEGDRFLNLFAYTGAASCIARNTGADTFHVDSSKNALAWAKSNMDESKLLNIRWVHEDALKFIQREVKRGNKFNGIVMDPPAWGIGAKGEKWKLEDKIDELMSAASEVLDEDGFLVMNTYSPMVDVTFITELSEMYFEGMKKEISELYMETKTDKFMYFGNLLRIG